MLIKALSAVLAMFLLTVPVALAQQAAFTTRELADPAYRLLKELHEYGVKNGLANVPPQDGRLLQILARMSGAKSVLEVGTSSGVSGIWLSLALKDTGGKLTTLEIDPERVKMARENFRQAGVEDRIQVIQGDALKTLPTLNGTYDMVFIDAAKPQYKQYLDLIFKHIPKGGVIVAHNAVRMADQMRDYLDYVRNSPDLDTVILTTGEDGVALSYKR